MEVVRAIVPPMTLHAERPVVVVELSAVEDDDELLPQPADSTAIATATVQRAFSCVAIIF